MSSSNKKTLASVLAELPEDFSEFATIYEKDLKPSLADMEQDRLKAMSRAKTYGVYALLALLIVGGLAIFIFKSPLAGIVGIVAAVGTAAFGLTGVHEVTKKARTMMVSSVASKFGLTYNEEPSAHANNHLQSCRNHKLVPSWDRVKLKDEMVGERNGRPFEFFQAHLEDKRTTTDSDGKTQTSWVTVFRGQCWVIDAAKTFHGTTRIARDAGIFNAFGAIGDKYSRAKLEDPEFEKKFEVYTTDQVEARFLLTPDVMQAFLDLETAFNGSKFRATFDGNKIYAALEGGELFEGGGLFSRIDDPEKVGELLVDIASVFHLVDVLGK
ncbi:MAG: hypothetical protein CMK07_04775 [Ponticaulis sp.]|nr:hypothetical protein [Ponticaulis sp.]